MQKDKIKCKFCAWATLAWRTNKKGKRISGYERLVRHVDFQHPEQLEKVRQFSKHFMEAP